MMPRRVVLLNRWFHPEVFGGTESSLWGLATALRDLGTEVTVVCETRGCPLGWQTVDGFRVYRHDAAPDPIHWSLRNTARYRHIVSWLRRLHRELAGQPVISRTHWYAAAARTVFPKVRLIYWCPGTGRLFEATERDSLTGRARHWASFEMLQSRIVERRALRGVNVVVAESGHVCRDLVEWYHLSIRKARVWRNGVDTKRFCPRPADEELLRELGLTRDLPVLLSAARFAPMKNLAFLVRAVAKMTDRRAHLILLGEGPEQGNLEQQAEAAGIRDRVHFPGFRSDVERFLSLAWAFVLPSTYEPYGNAFTEALAAGVPTLGLRPTANVRVPSDEHIVEGENGFLIEPGDEQQLATRLDLLVTDATLRTRLSDRARVLALERYNWHEVACRFGAALAEVVVP